MQILVHHCQACGFLFNLKIEESESWGQVVSFFFFILQNPDLKTHSRNT